MFGQPTFVGQDFFFRTKAVQGMPLMIVKCHSFFYHLLLIGELMLVFLERCDIYVPYFPWRSYSVKEIC